MARLDEFLARIFASPTQPLYAEFSAWVQASRRFRAFAEQYAPKIRAKLKQASDDERRRDLYAELDCARCLVEVAAFEVEYERYTASKQRGPDFTVLFKGHTRFNVEVRRLRKREASEGGEIEPKLLAVILEKVKQMPPSIVNVLWVLAEQPMDERLFLRTFKHLQDLAERKDEVFFSQRGFKHAADFLKQYRQLSAVMLRQTESPLLWQNPLARHPTPLEIVKILRRI